MRIFDLTQSKFDAAIKGQKVESIVFDDSNKETTTVRIILGNGVSIGVHSFFRELRDGAEYEFSVMLIPASENTNPKVLI